MNVTAPVRRCEARIAWRPGDWRLEPVVCGQSVAVATVIDATGTVRGACPRSGHRKSVVRRFGRYAGELVADEIAALDRHADERPWDADEAHEGSACCGAGGSTPHWVHCPERTVALADMAPGEVVEMYGR